MGIVLSVVVPLGLAVTLVWLRKRKHPSRERLPSSNNRHADGDAFQGIEIVAARDACDAVRHLEGKRFLSRSAPRLPLNDCTMSRCDCTFKKIGDRRADIRRWSDYGVETALFAGDERRSRDMDRRT